MPFWIDSLCIPVQPMYKEIRRLAVSRINDVFRDAYQILVLDAELQSISVPDTIEGFMRISLCRWMRRLWTLLEGAVGSRVHVKFHNRMFSLDDSYHEIGPNRKPGSVDPRRKDPRTLLAGSLTADATMFYWKIRSFRTQVVDEEERKFYGYSGFTSLDSLDVQEKAAIARRCFGIIEAFSASRYRTTSRIEDVYLCLANLLGWDTSDLRSVPVEQRMKLLFESQSILPQGILFVQGLRMAEPGWKWAVTGFDDGRQPLAERLVLDSTPGQRDKRGLTVVYPALALPTASLADDVENIVVSTAAADDGVVPHWHIRFATAKESHTAHQPANAYVDDTKSSHQFPSARLCVLFYRPQWYILRDVPMAAVLVSILQQEGRDIESILGSEEAVLCDFIQIGLVEVLSSAAEVDALTRRPDLQVVRLDKPARLMRDRAWIIR
jgi:hypothetical protein